MQIRTMSNDQLRREIQRLELLAKQRKQQNTRERILACKEELARRNAVDTVMGNFLL